MSFTVDLKVPLQKELNDPGFQIYGGPKQNQSCHFYFQNSGIYILKFCVYGNRPPSC